MTPPDRLVHGTLPARVREALGRFEEGLGARIEVVARGTEPGALPRILYASEGFEGADAPGAVTRALPRGEHASFELRVATDGRVEASSVADLLEPIVAFALETDRELTEFTYELSERFEEINLLYSISETIGTTVDLVAAAHQILGEVCDVMGAKRGSIWVYRRDTDRLHLAADAGEVGREEPMSPGEPDTITAMVFREGRSIIATRARGPERPGPESAARHGEGDEASAPARSGEPSPGAARRAGEGTARAREATRDPDRARWRVERRRSPREGEEDGDSFLSVPIRYSAGRGAARTVGVINLIGRRDGGRFTSANERLLAAVASQVGAAIENTRLVRKTLSRERMVREMELAHDLQMKLLPDPSAFRAAEAAGRVEPTEQVGGDFYQLFQLPEGRVGVMLGDVSLHGFPSALIMTLAMSATNIYAREHDSPASVLRGLDGALRDELETTEMFLTAFYGVLDPGAGRLVYTNAGHPHAFAIRADGTAERLEATDPPVGFAGDDAYHERSVPWTPGRDLLFLFTDGLSDALATDTRGNGERLVVETAVRHRFSSPERVVDALFELKASGAAPGAGDDRTALVVRV